MNWYKKAQRFFNDKDKMTYLSIGHDEGYVYIDNILWIAREGTILTKEETEEFPDHTQAFNVSSWNTIYHGRYEKDTGRISIKKPVKGVGAYRDTPQSLINSLYKTFPNITQIYEF